jgi:hypothetical protein
MNKTDTQRAKHEVGGGPIPFDTTGLKEGLK